MALNKAYFTRMSPELANVLEMAKRKYQEDFLGLYQALAGHYMKGEGRRGIEESKQKVVEIVKNIDKLLNFSEEATPQKIATLDKSMDEVEKDFKQWTETFTHEDDQKIMESLIEKRGLSLKKLSQQQKVIKSRIKKLNKGSGFASYLGKEWEDTNTFTKDILKSTLSGVAGPFGGIAQAAFGAGRQILDRQKARREAIERENFVSSTLTGKDTSPSTFASNLNTLNSFAPVPSFVEPKDSDSGSRVSKVANVAAGLAGIGGFRGTTAPSTKNNFTGMADAVSDGLKHFFNSGYKSAKWTKDIYDKLVGIPRPKRDEEHKDSPLGGMLSGFLNSLKGMFSGLPGSILAGVGNVLKGATPVAAVAGAGLAGWGAGRFLGEHVKWGGETLDQHTQDFFGSVYNKLFRRKQFDELNKQNKLNLERNKVDPNQLIPIDQIPSYNQEGGMVDKTTDVKTKASLDSISKSNVQQRQKDLQPTTKISLNKGTQTPLIGGTTTIVGAEGISIPSTNKEVPIDTTNVDGENQTAEQLSEINRNLNEIKEGNKNQTTSQNSNRSGYDAYNVRDPLLASLNSGTLDLS